ncbi:MIP/aquaporin family protein [Conchiformibius kuhniae]|uniref:MIP/aquaporin family protein n=1 Tax=Conchiformibius kuhniae TaxID=211502 RepID=A0A8T9MVA0_9NEIS|nr:MIP/aquaporin family protein [Conchiformibius kuhniae]
MNPFTAEILGTALLILLGNGVVAGSVLKNTKIGTGGGWMVITTAWAFAVYAAVVVAGPASGAHLNPAVSIGLATAGLFEWAQVPMYIAAQFIGAMLGAVLVWLFYGDHFAITEDEGAKRACFCTEPAIRNLPRNFFNEAMGAFVLLLVIFYIVGSGEITLPQQDAATPIGLGSLGALPVAILVWVIGLSLGSTTGYAINPARDGGPRIVLTLLGNKLGGVKPDWGYGIVPLTAPIVGAVAAALLFLLLK